MGGDERHTSSKQDVVDISVVHLNILQRINGRSLLMPSSLLWLWGFRRIKVYVYQMFGTELEDVTGG